MTFLKKQIIVVCHGLVRRLRPETLKDTLSLKRMSHQKIYFKKKRWREKVFPHLTILSELTLDQGS